MERTPNNVPYFVHEQMMARMERINKRLFIFCMVCLIALIGTNAYWVYYENSFEDVVTTVTQDSLDGNNNYIGNDGDITNGITADSY